MSSSSSSRRKSYDKGRSDQIDSTSSKKSHKKSKNKRTYQEDKDDDRHKRDRKRSTRKSESRSQSPQDFKDQQSTKNKDFDIKTYRSFLDKMFFRSSDPVSKGSSTYDDFWKFYEKFQNVKRLKDSKTTSKKSPNKKPKLVKIGNVEIPDTFSKKHTIPFKLKYSNVEDYITLLNPEDQVYIKRKVPETELENFLQILMYFLDFLQKEKFTKLKKLRESQASLPIAQYREEIISILSKHNVLIVAGDTGCGKSTQVPQYLLKAGYSNIACTQPRRIACLSLSKRVAFETLNEFGSEIGYQIRFEKRKTQHTKVVFITEGLLLRQVSSDSMLSGYNVIVLDEVHERHLHGDFLLGIVKCLLYQRSDVKIILMSATINTELFQNYFQGLAPILQVPGRLYPIKMQYRPVSIEELNTKSGKLNPAPYVRILQLIDDKYPSDERGDVLVFLSGLNEITTVVEACQLYAEQTKRWIILPLHSMLSIDDQDKAFDYPPEGVRKCIMSTNIAETSITIDGIRFVVDSGKVKEMAYDPQCKMQRLKEFWISKASAEQRKGRAGRTGPGVCFRLYSDKDYQEFNSYSTPEIQRVPLDSLLLQMISIGIPDSRKFPFIEPPSLENIESSIIRLKEQNALSQSEELTEMGKTLSQLPVDISIGKMLIMGTLFEQIESALSLAAALSVPTPFTNWAHRDQDCIAARKSLDSDHGDPLTLLNAYRAWLAEKSADGSYSKKWCKKRGFEEQRFYEMTKLRQQFKSLLTDAHLISNRPEPLLSSSSERAMRHGELKHLRSLKRDFHMAGPKKKKILKLEEGYDAGDLSEREEEGNIDIRDVEFRMRNDQNQVKNLLNQSTPYGHEDLMMLKVILCSGLYPQFGVPDDFNKFKGDAEQVYHTKTKAFTLIHPMSIFSAQTEVLRLTDSDIIQISSMNTKLPISSKHQLLCYLNLLETNKPYLMNAFRMPALQTLFLFSNSIDSDASFTRFVFDSWLEVEVADSVSASILVAKSINLRSTWVELLEKRLIQKDDIISSSDKTKGRELSSGLVKFLRTEVFYTLRRLVAADQKCLYDYNFKIDLNEFEKAEELGVVLNNKKGGVSLSTYFTYGSLSGEEPEPVEWTCHLCEWETEGIPLKWIIHLISCQRLKAEEKRSEDDIEEVKQNAYTKAFHCSSCDKEFHMTSIEILRHKNEHLSK